MQVFFRRRLTLNENADILYEDEIDIYLEESKVHDFSDEGSGDVNLDGSFK